MFWDFYQGTLFIDPCIYRYICLPHSGCDEEIICTNCLQFIRHWEKVFLYFLSPAVQYLGESRPIQPSHRATKGYSLVICIFKGVYCTNSHFGESASLEPMNKTFFNFVCQLVKLTK
jgi:hypothetical protein